MVHNAGQTPMPASERKRVFAKAKNRRGRMFTTDHYYVFHFWQHLLDCAKFELELGVGTFDVAKHLDGQPLQLMAQCSDDSSDDRWLWRFFLQHERQQ
jgi:hypothetical protein